jgi:hypothetical protein
MVVSAQVLDRPLHFTFARRFGLQRFGNSSEVTRSELSFSRSTQMLSPPGPAIRHKAATGARWPTSGLKRQDDDLVVSQSAEAAAAFKRAFNARFVSGQALPVGENRCPCAGDLGRAIVCKSRFSASHLDRSMPKQIVRRGNVGPPRAREGGRMYTLPAES